MLRLVAMESLLIGAAGGLIAGAVLLLVEYFIRRHERNRDVSEQKIIEFENEERRVTETIFNYLGPGSSVELMKSELGPPNRNTRESIGLFSGDCSEHLQYTNSYVYLFKNALVKLTSNDGETINSLTVLGNNSDIAFNNLFFTNPDAQPEFLNVATVTQKMLEGCRVEDFPGCRDSFAAVQQPVGNPFYVHITYFCDYSGQDVAKNPELLIGSVIHGICLSSEQATASYIFTGDVLYGK